MSAYGAWGRRIRRREDVPAPQWPRSGECITCGAPDDTGHGTCLSCLVEHGAEIDQRGNILFRHDEGCCPDYEED